jgi:ABC-2 type transport system ATP-binding protein
MTDLRSVLEAAGAGVAVEGDDALIVTGLECRDVGTLAANAGITLYELSRQEASLEEAFMEMTRESVDYVGDSSAAGSVA